MWCPGHGCTQSCLYFRSGLPAPYWCPAPGGGRGGGPAQLGAGGGDLGSLPGAACCLLAPYFWGLRVLLVEREAAQLSLRLLLAVLSGAWGLVVLLLSKFCIMILPYFLSFYFLVVILSGDRQPVLVPVLVQLLVAALVVEDSIARCWSRTRRGGGTLPALCSVETHCNMFLQVFKQDLPYRHYCYSVFRFDSQLADLTKLDSR